MLGRSIDGRYRIDSLIGAGGMGTVYRATRLLIGDEVAIKILHQDHADANSYERFRREAQAAARLKHPNAVSIYDFGISTDGLQYLVMEFVEGESLRETTESWAIRFYDSCRSYFAGVRRARRSAPPSNHSSRHQAR